MRSHLYVLVLVAFAAFAAGLEQFETTGTHYQVGFATGKKFSKVINDFLASYDPLNKVLIPYYESTTGRPICDKFFAGNQQAYPHYFRELIGLADGCEVDLIRILLLNFEDELGQIISPTQAGSRVMQCGDVLMHSASSGLALAHNEDGDAALRNTTFLLTAHIRDGSLEQQDFTAYVYPGYLPGVAFGFNKHGIAFSMDSVWPVAYVIGGLGTAFITRDVLGATTMADAVKRASPLAAAYGISLNVLSLHEQALSQVETSGNLSSSVSVSSGSHYYHFNMYRHLNTKQFSDASSVHRLARADQMAAPTNIAGVVNILGDTADKQYPIYRTSTPPDQYSTVATCVFDAQSKTARVYIANPKTSQPLYTLPLQIS